MTSEKHDYTRDADSWLQWADQTYGAAHKLFHGDSISEWFPAAILGHHALEMYLKAILIREGHRVVKDDVWGHDLVELAKDIKVFKDENAAKFNVRDVHNKLQIFTDYFNELRYPENLNAVDGLGEDEGYLLDALVKLLRPFAKMVR